MNNNDALSQLVALSRSLGEPANDYVILGEGNTSARADETSFWVKASGTELRTIGAERALYGSLSTRCRRCSTGQILGDEETRQALQAAKVDPEMPGHPSVETVLHALCLQLPGIHFVGHTHPTAINVITCSQALEEAVNGRLFPDEIVVCGPATVVVPYTDPGLPLAREVQRRIADYIETYDEIPKTILMQNHGFIALGASPRQVENITAMAVKSARIPRRHVRAWRSSFHDPPGCGAHPCPPRRALSPAGVGSEVE